MPTQQRYIYIVLSDTGSLLSRMIRLYTKNKLNHVSIAFDKELNEVYSFGRKCPHNLFVSGFTQEDMRGVLFKDAKFKVFRYAVSETQYLKIRDIMERFKKDEPLYKYNFLGLLGVMFNRPVERDHAFFCSQFVAHVLEQAGVQLMSQCAALTTPSDFERSEALELTDIVVNESMDKEGIDQCYKISWTF